MKNNWKGLIKDIAPVVGTALGGPLGGVATRYLAEHWLGNADAGHDEIAWAIEHASPEQIADLRRLDLEFQLELEKLGMMDRADARARDVAKGGNNWRADFLALIAIIGLVLCVWFIARDTAMPERAVNAIMFIAGILAAAVKDVYAFEFGSSRGSKEKDDTIARLK
jgi:hypothetical protein